MNEEVLQSLVREAEFDSSGRFTLDFAQSRSRWENLARGDRTAFLRLALQAGLAAGPTVLDIEADTRTLTVTWEGAECGPAELAHLYAYFSGQEDEFRNPSLQFIKQAALLSSCRPDLQLSIGGGERGLVIGHEGPSWGPAGRPGLSFARIGPRPLDYLPNPFTVDLFSPLITSAWPELTEVRPHFCDLPASVRLCGTSFFSDSLRAGINKVQFGQSEVGRCAIVHPQPERNGVGISLRQLPKPLCYLAPANLICLSTEGERLKVRPGARLRACVAFVIFSQPAADDAGRWDHSFRVMKYGWPMLNSPDWCHAHVKAALDGSDLPTDISGAKAVLGAELEERMQQGRAWIGMGLEALLAELQQQPGWRQTLSRGHARLVAEALHSFRQPKTLGR